MKAITHTSMRGVQINMEEMRSQNQESVAVTGRGSNVRMNANGDTLDKGGLVNKRREQIEQDYNKIASGRVKNIDPRSLTADAFETPAEAVKRLTQAPESVKKQVDEPVLAKRQGRKIVEKDE